MRYPKYLFLLLLLGIIYIACEKTDDSVLDPTLKFPQIDTVTVTPNTIDSDTLYPIITAKVTSEETVESVTAKVINPDNVVLSEYILKDDGVSPDVSAGDGIYSARLDILLSCRLIGAYRIEFTAKNVSGTTSPSVIGNFSVTRTGNLPPSISQLIVTPDSTQAGVVTGFRFRVVAIDPNGSCDLRRVFYTGTNPLGGNLTPRDLFDDGSCCPIDNGPTSGDSTSNDGIYTRLLVGSTTDLGYFRYQFKAVDRSGDTSNVLNDSILVYP